VVFKTSFVSYISFGSFNFVNKMFSSSIMHFSGVSNSCVTLDV
jgi:hypothetical protein